MSCAEKEEKTLPKISTASRISAQNMHFCRNAADTHKMEDFSK